MDLLRDEVPAFDATNYTTSQLVELLETLQNHKYSVIVLSSFQLGDDQLMDPNSTGTAAVNVQSNLRKIAANIDARGMTIIPEVMPVGQSERILQYDRCLAEATPVRNMTFHVE